jgi:hypothetical protein
VRLDRQTITRLREQVRAHVLFNLRTALEAV